jgi:hypothetical protein
VTIHFYGFLHLEDREKSAVNVRAGSFKRQSRIYVLNALGLARSLRAHGYSFTLLTNDEDLIHEVAPDAAGELDLVTMSFSTKVPSGVRFYSGHFKLDVFHYLGGLDKDYVALIDLDMLCVNPAPRALTDAIASKTGLYYDITSQVVPATEKHRLGTSWNRYFNDLPKSNGPAVNSLQGPQNSLVDSPARQNQSSSAI